MSNQVSITDLLTAIGSDNIRFQDLMRSMENINSKKGATVISFATDAMSPGDVVTGAGPKGLVLWIDRRLMQQRLEELKAGHGLTYDKLLEQHNELLAALEEAAEIIGAETHAWKDADRYLSLIAKAKGGAA